MSKYARRRDNCERGIVDALRAHGATVQQLDAMGVPDLLVGYRGTNILMECKDEHGKQDRAGKRTESGLRPTQETWFRAWKGLSPVIVTTPDEAIIALTFRGNAK